MAADESARLIRALRKESIPCRRIVINQVLTSDRTEAFLRMKVGSSGAVNAPS